MERCARRACTYDFTFYILQRPNDQRSTKVIGSIDGPIKCSEAGKYEDNLPLVFIINYQLSNCDKGLALERSREEEGKEKR